MVILVLIKPLTIFSFQERTDNIVNNILPLVKHNNYNKKEKYKNAVIIGDSMLNNINSRGLSKSNKVLPVIFLVPPVKIFWMK